MNTSAKKQIIPELLAAVLWGILTLWTDRLFFRYDWRTTAFFVYKALFVLLAFLALFKMRKYQFEFLGEKA